MTTATDRDAAAEERKYRREQRKYRREQEAEQVKRRSAVLDAMAEPDKAWSRVLGDAAMGNDTTSSLLLAIAAELRKIRRRLTGPWVG